MDIKQNEKDNQHCGNALLPDALMAPRYKVIADYPLSNKTIGEIIKGEATYFVSGISDADGRMEEYPHLFKKLEWWEERKVEEMPKYLKIVKGDFKEDYFKIGQVSSYNKKCAFIVFQNKGVSYRPVADTVPASESEYLSYIEGLKK